MGNPFSGRNAYVYVGGVAVIHLKDWNLTVTKSIVQLDPDIGSSWNYSADGFLGARGTINYNFTQAGDFQTLFDALTGTSASSIYLYPESGASKAYLYGSFWLTDLGHTNALNGTVTGSVGIQSNGSVGRQVTSA